VRAQINHMAMVNPNWPMMGRFYEAMFGFKQSGKVSRPANGISVGDGYVGLNINPLRDGYIGGLDHFGMVVDEIEEAQARMQRKFPKASIVKRPSTRPFAQYSAHDPDGNVFDLAEPKSKLNEIYAVQQENGGWTQERYLNKFAIRTLNAEACAEFYHEVFGLQLVNRKGDDSGFYLCDGRVTLALLPWSIPIFEGMAIKRPGPDHIGVKVESIAAFTEHMRSVAGSNPYLAPMPLGGSKESDARRDFLAHSCGGKMQIADPGAVWIDITDE
jgi:catechol 2,3-dioxygenase-like lactoylglutathione lyase family enzyme